MRKKGKRGSVGWDFASSDGMGTDDLVELGWNWLKRKGVSGGLAMRAILRLTE
jgi:hypothetical protein